MNNLVTMALLIALIALFIGSVAVIGLVLGNNTVSVVNFSVIVHICAWIGAYSYGFYRIFR